MIYLDHNATTPIRPQVVEAMARACVELPGNPSSVHAAGRAARDAVERARGQVAAFVGAQREEIVFTSGGTEADNLAIRGLARLASKRGRRRVLTSPLDHPAVLGAVAALADEGFTVMTLPVSSRGEIAVADLDAVLTEDTALVTVALCNHELGNVYPVAALAAAARARGAFVHTDAVQAAGKVPLDLPALGVDAAAISAHKIGGPKGVGAVFIGRGVDLPPLLSGGHQERERRPGTENVAAIIGFGIACELAAAALAEEANRFQVLRRRLIPALLGIPGARILGVGGVAADVDANVEVNDDGAAAAARPAGSLPGTTLVTFPGAPGQLVAIGLDLEGICVSTGAACTSGSLEPSPVLRALGLSPRQAGEGVRISFGWTTTASDIDRLGAVLPAIVARVRAAVLLPASGDDANAASALALGGAA